jgi:hypothetical protein
VGSRRLERFLGAVHQRRGLGIFLLGMFRLLPILLNVIPLGAILPILIYIGLVITFERNPYLLLKVGL